MYKYTAVLSREAVRAAEVLSEWFDIFLLPPDGELSPPVSCHADMILFNLGENAVLPVEYCLKHQDDVKRLSQMMGLHIIPDDSPRDHEYPHDVGLNVLLCSSFAFSLEKFTSPCVKKLLQANGIEHINVKQGYSACSALSLGDAVITADYGIAKAAMKAGLDVLLISSGSIHLDGYNEGFIGGASGVCGKDIYFLGNIERHPDEKKIRCFAESRGFKCISLYDDELCDFGGIKFIENRLIPRTKGRDIFPK